MKLSGRKNFSLKKKTDPALILSESDNSFYEQHSGETPLTTSPAKSAQQGSHTSRHTPVRRRENSNRATNRDMSRLLLKIVLIPLLLIGAFFGLRAVVEWLNGPTEKERLQWAANAELMEKVPGASTTLPAEPAGEASINKEFLAGRVSRWEKAQRHLRAADALDRRGIDGDAISRLEQALQASPDSREALWALAKLYISSGNHTAAIPLCIRLLDQDSTQWEVKRLLLRALQAGEETEMSALLSDQMLLQQPGDLGVLEMAAYAHAAAGDTDVALGLYKRILEDNPEHLLALAGVGYIHQWREEWVEAVPYYLELLKLDPKAEYYLALARCYAQQDDAGKTLIFLGQAAGLYGAPTVSPWLKNPELDPVRETTDFRSFVDRMVGEQTRTEIEALRRHEIPKETLREAAGRFKLPSASELQILRPGQQQR